MCSILYVWLYRNTFFPAFALFHKTPKGAHGVRQIMVNSWTGLYTKFPLSGTFSYNLPFRDSLKEILEGTAFITPAEGFVLQPWHILALWGKKSLTKV